MRRGSSSSYCIPLIARRRHSDNLNNLVIASVSLGAERTFIMSPRLPSKSTPKKRQLSADEERSLQGRKNVRLSWVQLSRPLLPSFASLRLPVPVSDGYRLANGSLLVMQGEWSASVRTRDKGQGRVSWGLQLTLTKSGRTQEFWKVGWPKPMPQPLALHRAHAHHVSTRYRERSISREVGSASPSVSWSKGARRRKRRGRRLLVVHLCS
jgi:hypothetical protein